MEYANGPDFAPYVLAAAMLLVAVVTQLSASGKIGRNGFVGIRIPPTMASDAGWRAGHKAALVPIWIGFVLVAVAAAVAQFMPQAMIACIGLLLLSLAWGTAAAWRAAKPENG